jgi:hypothetical protein
MLSGGGEMMIPSIVTVGLYGIGLFVLAVMCGLGIVALFWILAGLIWLKNEIIREWRKQYIDPGRDYRVDPEAEGPASPWISILNSTLNVR